MKVYIVEEFKDYYNSEIIGVFANEEDAKKLVETNYWEDENGPGIFYNKYEVI